MRCREYKFGDFQCNSAMSLNNSEKLKGKVKGGPKAIAEAIVAQLEPNKIVGSVSIVKTGIINIRLKDELLVAAVKESVCTGRGPAMPPVPQKKVAVDFSSPNIAKVVMRHVIIHSHFFLSANIVFIYPSLTGNARWSPAFHYHWRHHYTYPRVFRT